MWYYTLVTGIAQCIFYPCFVAKYGPGDYILYFTVTACVQLLTLQSNANSVPVTGNVMTVAIKIFIVFISAGANGEMLSLESQTEAKPY